MGLTKKEIDTLGEKLAAMVNSFKEPVFIAFSTQTDFFSIKNKAAEKLSQDDRNNMLAGTVSTTTKNLIQ